MHSDEETVAALTLEVQQLQDEMLKLTTVGIKLITAMENKSYSAPHEEAGNHMFEVSVSFLSQGTC